MKLNVFSKYFLAFFMSDLLVYTLSAFLSDGLVLTDFFFNMLENNSLSVV